jgi:glycogen(starch) synthase
MTHLARVNFGLARALVEADRSGTWDVIHCHDWMVAPAAIFARDVLQIPVLLSIHTDAGSTTVGTLEDRRRRLDWESALARISSLLLAVSRPVQRTLSNRYPNAMTRFLPNGIDASQFAQPNVLRHPERILFAGRLVPYKGCQDAIRAIAILRRDWPGIGLDVVGDGFYRPELEALVDELGLGDAIVFKGWKEGNELATAFARATLAVIPSHEDAFGIVAIEAMAAGCPVVTTSIPAFASYIEDNRTGLLAATGNPVNLARQVDRLLRNPVLRATLARNAMQEIVPKHDWRAVAGTAETAYRHALEG